MSIESYNIEENRIKHLEFLENNISRMNSCCFQMKGWAITIASALIALYAASFNDACVGNEVFILIAIFPTILFWVLDNYYLLKEKKFMSLYKDVAGISKQGRNITPFAMSIRLDISSYIKTLITSVNSVMYISMIIGLIVFYIIQR